MNVTIQLWELALSLVLSLALYVFLRKRGGKSRLARLEAAVTALCFNIVLMPGVWFLFKAGIEHSAWWLLPVAAGGGIAAFWALNQFFLAELRRYNVNTTLDS